MSSLDNLIQELAFQNGEQTIGDTEDGGVNAILLRGDLLELADEYGYTVGERLQEQLQGLTGAIVYTSEEDVSVETFNDDEELDEQWSVVVASIENAIELAAD